MSDDRERTLAGDAADEEAMRRLLRVASQPAVVPEDAAARVRASVHSHWRTRSRQRTVRRRAVALSGALAAAAALVLVAGRLASDEPAAVPGEPIAVVEQVVGNPWRVAEARDGAAARRLVPQDAIRIGEWLETDDRGRVGLRFADGSSLRLDVASRARALSARAIELSAGAVYIDTGAEASGFEVRTPLGTARDIGTQFEVRLADRAVRVRVRTGMVEVQDGSRALLGGAGTEITMSRDRAVSMPIATYGPDWEWMASVAPPLESEGLALAVFLENLSREHGWRLRYADAGLAREAAGIILYGPVGGLGPLDAVEVAVTTSGLAHRFDDGELLVLRRPASR